MHKASKLVVLASIALFLPVTRTLFAAGDGRVATPVFSPSGGAYCSVQAVKIDDTTPNATIYYTTNGETPTTSSTKYSAPITVSKTATIKAIAEAAGHETSAVGSSTYTFHVHDREWVLCKLDEAAKNFRSTQADFQFDSVETDPIYEKDVQKGTVYYERKAGAFQMSAHISEFNGKPVPKIYAYTGGAVKLYEPLINQLTTFSKAAQYESWFMLGFGASGKDLEQMWEIKYIGSEILDGVKTEMQEMVPKDPAIRKNLSKVTLWVDPIRGVSLKQVLNFGPTEYKVCVYFNIRVNEPLPVGVFTIKTNSKTVLVNR